MTNPPSPSVHRFAVFTAGCTFLLLVAGALVTSNDAGLAVPDWPLSYGSLTPPMVGGIVYEHTHRVVAASVGLLTIVLTAWIWRREPRRWVRRMGLLALGAVIAQGLLGGLTVKLFLPTTVSVAHATLAQLFFATVVSLALFTSRWWQTDQPQAQDLGSPPLRLLAAASVAAIFLQLVLGAAFRHRGFGIVPHLAGAAVVTVSVLATASALRRRFPGQSFPVRCARMLTGVLVAQLLLGGAAWWSRSAAREFPQPLPMTVWLTVAHTVVGALTLAAAVIVALVCYRLLRPAVSATVASGAQPIKERVAL